MGDNEHPVHDHGGGGSILPDGYSSWAQVKGWRGHPST